MADQTWQESAAEIWQLFKETDAKFKETQQELNQRFKETDAKFKETQQELEQRFKETDAQIEKTNRQLGRLEGLFGMQWGRMMEALVQPSAIHLFQERGIQVQYVYQRVKSQLNGRSMELDLLLENGDEIVVIEVKSTLRVDDVKEFLTDLTELFEFFPKYRAYKVYAGVAGLDIVQEADKYAARQGLFVLHIVGDGLAQIKNTAEFQPKDFAQTN